MGLDRKAPLSSTHQRHTSITTTFLSSLVVACPCFSLLPLATSVTFLVDTP
ncbi:hypothetical protein Leryth_008502 [Lithospermum erythrorhizon]|nr:hypothetical protein Leryth_008502 [Lithospermum erythrorhizon]